MSSKRSKVHSKYKTKYRAKNWAADNLCSFATPVLAGCATHAASHSAC